ncbi:MULTISPECIES: metal-dependent hydrolase [Thermoanaerobacter]|jgi:inner membrane protein|uniref:Inner membrane protein n=1 Tax=Thermoanaerobacter pentosaceus TaxID=694059 RepID=A0ABT9M2N8_9THEO|nr:MULTISPECIES: metal-dependent hydrolase [Thermoanaerobacter]MDP9750378.1 inner membrane protein [Thermoanaerobacter pentosaceus]
MLGRTHIAIALAATALIVKNPAQLPFSLTVAAASALLPDIDTPEGTLRRQINKYTGVLTFPVLIVAGYFLFKYRYFSLISLMLYLTYIVLAFIGSHRGFTHSLAGFIFFTLILFMSNKTIILPAIIGYGTHLAADLLTPSGIPLLYPYNKSFKIPLVRTGSLLDISIGLTFSLMFVAVLFQKFI